MIARWARLERIRGRQLDRARAEVVRANALVVQRQTDIVTAEGEYIAITSTPCEVGAIEHAVATIDGTHVALATAGETAEAAREHAAVAARAWQRADVALARAKAEREQRRGREEARAQDEHASRRHR